MCVTVYIPVHYFLLGIVLALQVDHFLGLCRIVCSHSTRTQLTAPLPLPPSPQALLNLGSTDACLRVAAYKLLCGVKQAFHLRISHYLDSSHGE